MNTADVMKAIQSDDIESLKKLFTSQPELAAERDENGNSPLLISAYYSRNAMVRVILRACGPTFSKHALPDLRVMWHGW
jgi:hypothetical protein